MGSRASIFWPLAALFGALITDRFASAASGLVRFRTPSRSVVAVDVSEIVAFHASGSEERGIPTTTLRLQGSSLRVSDSPDVVQDRIGTQFVVLHRTVPVGGDDRVFIRREAVKIARPSGFVLPGHLIQSTDVDLGKATFRVVESVEVVRRIFGGST